MGRLISTTGGRDVFLEDADPKVQELLDSGQYKLAPGETRSIVDPFGHQSVVDAGVVDREAAQGIQNTVEAQDVVVQRARAKRLEGQTSTAGSLLRGVASGVTGSLSDSLFDEDTIEADAMHHGTARAIGEGLGIGGSLFLNPEGRLLGMLGKGGATAAKISEEARALAVAGDGLAAERLGGALSSNALLAGKGTNATERALARSGRVLDEATLARQGLAEVPADLVGLDAAALRRAAAEERAALKAGASEERLALEEARKPLRAEVARDVESLHRELMTERPIFTAVAGADVRKLEGVGDIASQLNKSFRSLRGTLDNPIRVAENPELLVGPLQMRQAALESLQAKSADLRAFFNGDARAVALDHVDDALTQTRSQIARIQELSKSNPVTSARLAELESGMSPRMLAIESAQEALKQAPELGLVAKGAQSAVFAGATELARAIPGVGALAPFVGKWASESIGRTFEHLGAMKAQLADRSRAALDAFLTVTKKNPERVLGATARTAAVVLRDTRFAPSDEEDAPRGKTLADHFHARSAEIRSQTMYDATGLTVMRPEKRAELAKRLAPIAAVNPLLADKLETIAVRRAELIAQTMPRRPEVGGLQIGPDNWKPSDLEMRSWARTIRAAEDPESVEDDLARGVMTPEAAVAYRTVYPERFADLQRAIFAAAPTLSKTLPLKRKIALSIFTGVPLIPALQPNVLAVLQGTYRTEPGTAGGTQAPTAQPHFGALGSLKSADKPTKSQAREGA